MEKQSDLNLQESILQYAQNVSAELRLPENNNPHLRELLSDGPLAELFKEVQLLESKYVSRKKKLLVQGLNTLFYINKSQTLIFKTQDIEMLIDITKNLGNEVFSFLQKSCNVPESKKWNLLHHRFCRLEYRLLGALQFFQLQSPDVDRNLELEKFVQVACLVMLKELKASVQDFVFDKDTQDYHNMNYILDLLDGMAGQLENGISTMYGISQIDSLNG